MLKLDRIPFFYLLVNKEYGHNTQILSLYYYFQLASGRGYILVLNNNTYNSLII